MRQVVINLVSNAVKFTEQGEVAIHVEAVPTNAASDSTCCLQFSVVDTGIGVAEEKQKTIFEPFMQAMAP